MGLFDFLKKKEFAEIADLKAQLERYRPITDVEAEAKRLREEMTQHIAGKESELKQLQDNFVKLQTDYQAALATYTRLRSEVGLYENKLDLIEYGVYEPIYDFEKSDDYRKELSKIMDLQKQMISDEKAAICDANWTIDGSAAKGKESTMKYIKLALRAFNGDCESLIAKVKWNNANQIKERIRKSFDAINAITQSMRITIQPAYLDLKLKELALEYEYQLKRQQEKEELRAVQEALREEEKARREFEQAQKEAEKEEMNYQKALDKARKEMEQATGAKHDKLMEQIAKLELELKEAHERKERALSMAQQTKRGHVYIISNIGSFGEQVYKIGMTRRLEPEDRIKELGDASVPFQFDIHALIFSDDAPGLESALHKAFAERKVNMLNQRKEFFKVTLEEIEQKVKEMGLDTDFIRTAEAMEYRETLALLEKMHNPEPTKTVEQLISEEFPGSLG